jgi:hypothetical protein
MSSHKGALLEEADERRISGKITHVKLNVGQHPTRMVTAASAVV